MHFDRVGFRIMIQPPHVSQKFAPSDPLPWRIRQTPDQSKLARVEPEPLLADPAIPMEQVKHDWPGIAETFHRLRILTQTQGTVCDLY